VLAACLGNSFAVLLPAKYVGGGGGEESSDNHPSFRIFLIGLLEVTGNILGLLGLVLAGSGVRPQKFSKDQKKKKV